MNRPEVERTVREILTTNFAVPEEAFTPEATFRGTFGLDSLDIVDLVFFLQKGLGVNAELEDYRDLHTVDRLIDFIVARRAEQAGAEGAGAE